jgi:hypothetical protein
MQAALADYGRVCRQRRELDPLMAHVAGLDGTPDGWVAVLSTDGVLQVKKLDVPSDLFGGPSQFDIVAVDIPIGLLNAYETGGRTCDRVASSRALANTSAPAAANASLNTTQSTPATSGESAPRRSSIGCGRCSLPLRLKRSNATRQARAEPACVRKAAKSECPFGRNTTRRLSRRVRILHRRIIAVALLIDDF